MHHPGSFQTPSWKRTLSHALGPEIDLQTLLQSPTPVSPTPAVLLDFFLIPTDATVLHQLLAPETTAILDLPPSLTLFCTGDSPLNLLHLTMSAAPHPAQATTTLPATTKTPKWPSCVHLCLSLSHAIHWDQRVVFKYRWLEEHEFELHGSTYTWGFLQYGLQYYTAAAGWIHGCGNSVYEWLAPQLQLVQGSTVHFKFKKPLVPRL